MSKYSEVIGSFIRNGSFPLEADYVFASELELIEFYSESENLALLHQGWLKVVGEGDNQALYWVVKEGEELKFVKLLERIDRETLYKDLEDLEKKLDEEIKTREEADSEIWGNKDSVVSSLNNIELLSKAVNQLKTQMSKMISAVSNIIKGDSSLVLNDFESYLSTLDYPSIEALSKAVSKFFKEIDELDGKINTLPELQDFLEGYKDTDKLKDVLQNLYNSIVGNVEPGTTIESLRRHLLDLIQALNNKCYNLLTELDQTQQGVGLSGDGAYNADSETYYLQNATSVMNALKILDRVLHRQAGVSYEETDSVKLNDTISEDETTRIITADVKISEDSDIIIKKDGLYHKVDLTYNNGQVVLLVNGEERADFNIGIDPLLEEGYYDEHTEKIILIFKLHDGQSLRVEIPAEKLITEWETTDTDTISLNKTRVVDGNDELSAELLVNIRNGEGLNAIVENNIASNVASGNYSNASGNNTQATGGSSHAEGFNTLATAVGSHSEGRGTIALGEASHAEGLQTKTTNQAEHAEGKFNVSNDDTLSSIGNGLDNSNRHNVFEAKNDGTILISDINAEGEYYEKPMLNLQEKIKTIEDTLAEDLAKITELQGKLNGHDLDELENKVANIEDFLVDLDTNGYDYVDMGEAGIWATCNIGASKPEEYGLYFAWGDTSGHSNGYGEQKFTWETYKFGTQNNLTKYNSSDNLKVLEPEDDTAHVNMGGQWRMPTQAEFQKLIELCNSEYVTEYNGSSINGRLFKLKTDETKQLFIPLAGYIDGSYGGGLDAENYTGFYYSSSLGSTDIKRACFLYLDSNWTHATSDDPRCVGYPIRAILGSPSEKYLTKKEASELYQEKGDYATEEWVEEQGYLTEHQDLSDYATKDDITTINESIKALEEREDNDTIYDDTEIKDRISTIESALFDKPAGDPCDVVLVNNKTLEKIAVKVDDLELYVGTHTPIGVVVIPTSHDVYGTGEAGVMALLSASLTTPDEGQTTNINMYWGHNNVDTKLPNLDMVVHQGTTNGNLLDVVKGVISNGRMPLMSDSMVKKVECPTDPGTWYNTNPDFGSDPSKTGYIPSPYLADGSRNPNYYKTDSPSSAANAMSDFNGKSNTSILISLATAQKDWKTATSIIDKQDTGYSPAACTCWRYHTLGTSQGDWYLPACGELGYYCSRYDMINTTLSEISRIFNISVCEFQVWAGWSSSENGSTAVRGITFENGWVLPYLKDGSLAVRPFCRLKLGSIRPKNRLDDHIEEFHEKINEVNSKFTTFKDEIDNIDLRIILQKEYIDSKFVDYDTNGYEYVDMDEAGIWAKYPIGVTNWETCKNDILYFQWGDTQGYTAQQVRDGEKDFDWNDYKFGGNDYGGQTKYNLSDNLTILESEDDAACVNMRGSWRMPTKEEFQKLYDSCDTEWTDNYEGTGIKGRIFKLKTDESKQLFFPAVGTYSDRFLSSTSYGYVWSSSIFFDIELNFTDMAKLLNFSSSKISPQYSTSRSSGCNVQGFIPPVGPNTTKFLTKKEAEEYATKEDLNNIEIPEVDLSEIEAKLEGVTKAADDSEVIKKFFVDGAIEEVLPKDGTIVIDGGFGISVVKDNTNAHNIIINVDEHYIATREYVDDKISDIEIPSLDAYATKNDLSQLKSDILGDDLEDTFNTLKAVQDWADEHGTEYAELVKTVNGKVDTSTYESDKATGATKLATPVTIWGQSFDGTSNVTGNLINVGSINQFIEEIRGAGNGRLHIKGVEAFDVPDYIHLWVNANRGLILQEGYGNVGIGTHVATEKLTVEGNIKSSGTVTGTNITEMQNTIASLQETIQQLQQEIATLKADKADRSELSNIIGTNVE